MICTRCDGTGFINLHQVDDETLTLFDATGDVFLIFDWMAENEPHDVIVCDCCGDGESEWRSEPGTHDPDDPFCQSR